TGVPTYNGDGIPATSAAVWSPEGVAVDGAGNLYILDEAIGVRKVSASTGLITTIAGSRYPGFSGDGGGASSAAFYYPQGFVIDLVGNIFVADTNNNRIRKLTLQVP